MPSQTWLNSFETQLNSVKTQQNPAKPSKTQLNQVKPSTTKSNPTELVAKGKKNPRSVGEGQKNARNSFRYGKEKKAKEISSTTKKNRNQQDRSTFFKKKIKKLHQLRPSHFRSNPVKTQRNMQVQRMKTRFQPHKPESTPWNPWKSDEIQLKSDSKP